MNYPNIQFFHVIKRGIEVQSENNFFFFKGTLYKISLKLILYSPKNKMFIQNLFLGNITLDYNEEQSGYACFNYSPPPQSCEVYEGISIHI